MLGQIAVQRVQEDSDDERDYSLQGGVLWTSYL